MALPRRLLFLRIARRPPFPLRPYATIAPGALPPQHAYEVFDEHSKERQRDRAVLRLRQTAAGHSSHAGALSESDGVSESQSDGRGPMGVVDYLREEIAERLVERIEDLKIPPSSILDLSAHAGQLTRVVQEIIGDELVGVEEALQAEKAEELSRMSEAERASGVADEGAGKSEGGRKWWIVEGSREALHRDPDSTFLYPPTRIQASPSDLLANPDIQALREKIDCVISGGGLHWVGDIVGALTQVRHLLRPDGVFVGAVLGGDTLFELRTSLQLAEQERRGGIANRISPMISTTDAPSLLTRAGFTLTTVDVEDLTIMYPSIWELMSDLRDMGEGNAILGRRAGVARDVLVAAEAIYKELYGKEGEGIPATFQIIWMIGWKPGPTEPKPLARGSAQTNLKDVL